MLFVTFQMLSGSETSSYFIVLIMIHPHHVYEQFCYQRNDVIQRQFLEELWFCEGTVLFRLLISYVYL